MKRAKNEQEFPSPPFQLAGLTWKIQCYPNGNRPESEGSFNVYVKLMTMPPSWKHIELCRRIQCSETNTVYTSCSRYKRRTSNGWTNSAMLFPEISALNTLSFTIDILINKVVLDKGDRVFFERAIAVKPERIQWTVDQ